jgi:hypothetical protein
MARGNQGRDIYATDGDRELWSETLAEACEKTGWRIHAWVMMSKLAPVDNEHGTSNPTAARGHPATAQGPSRTIGTPNPLPAATDCLDPAHGVQVELDLNPVRHGIEPIPNEFRHRDEGAGGGGGLKEVPFGGYVYS